MSLHVFISEYVMIISTLNECLWILVGGLVCGFTSFLVADYSNSRTKLRRRIEYAVISGIGAMAICYYAAKFFPEKFDVTDAPAFSVFVGLFGIGRVLRFISNRFGYSSENTEDREP